MKSKFRETGATRACPETTDRLRTARHPGRRLLESVDFREPPTSRESGLPPTAGCPGARSSWERRPPWERGLRKTVIPPLSFARTQVSGAAEGKEWSGSRPVSRVLSRAAIHLGRASPRASSDLPGSGAGHACRSPIWSCSRWGLPCHRCCHRRGALLPHLFTLTRTWRAVYFLWHFPWARAPQALPGTPPCGARTFLSAANAAQRLPGRLPRV